MRTLFLFFTLLIITAMPIIGQATDGKKPALLVVKFNAEWCVNCRIIAPELKDARSKHNLDDLDVLFVTLDLTDETTRNQATLMAYGLGLDKLYRDNSSRTGFALVVNSETGETVGRITRQHKADDIASIVKRAINSL